MLLQYCTCPDLLLALCWSQGLVQATLPAKTRARVLVPSVQELLLLMLM